MIALQHFFVWMLSDYTHAAVALVLVWLCSGVLHKITRGVFGQPWRDGRKRVHSSKWPYAPTWPPRYR